MCVCVSVCVCVGGGGGVTNMAHSTLCHVDDGGVDCVSIPLWTNNRPGYTSIIRSVGRAATVATETNTDALEIAY